jgi:hypothetical protein
VYSVQSWFVFGTVDAIGVYDFFGFGCGSMCMCDVLRMLFLYVRSACQSLFLVIVSWACLIFLGSYGFCLLACSSAFLACFIWVFQWLFVWSSTSSRNVLASVWRIVELLVL